MIEGKLLLKSFSEWHSIDIKSEEYRKGDFADICGQFKKEDQLFLIQVSDFIREFDKEFEHLELPCIIDIQSFVKQFLQTPKPLENQEKWNLFRLLKEKKYISMNFRLDSDSLKEYLLKINQFLIDISKQSGDEELQRLSDVEVPLNRILYDRERKGVHINITSELVRNLEEEFYDYKNILQLKYNIFTPDSNETQISLLKKKGIEINDSLLRLFKTYRSLCEEFELIYKMIRTKSDLDCLLYMQSSKGGSTKTYPSFHGFGTITSRITLREPALQNLRRKIRNVIVPEENHEFIYIDYSQFEAGILASLSEDTKLCELYNDDIYNDLNKKVWNNSKERDDAKVLFYRFMYGDSSMRQNEKNYFNSFDKLISYKDEIKLEVQKKKKIGTKKGNYRMIDNALKYGLSHKIQATASLIFKNALIRVYREVEEANFVLPMHDAALYEVNILKCNKEKVESNIKRIFKEEFAKICPGINHEVTCSSFYEDKKNI